MAKIKIVLRNCPRCGKSVAGLSKAIHGSEAMRLKFAGLCSTCATEEEKREILEDQAKGILSKGGK